MSLELIGLAALMLAVTYPARAIPLLTPRLDRLPPVVGEYLRLMGPAVLGAIAAIAVLAGVGADGRPVLLIGWEAVAVVLGAAVVAWRRTLALGLVVAVALIAGIRAAGLG